MHQALQDDIDRLYVSRKEGGRGLSSIEDCVDVSIQGLKKYEQKKTNYSSNIRTNRKTTKTRKQKWKKKQLYGYFKQQTGKIANEETWM